MTGLKKCNRFYEVEWKDACFLMPRFATVRKKSPERSHKPQAGNNKRFGRSDPASDKHFQKFFLKISLPLRLFGGCFALFLVHFWFLALIAVIPEAFCRPEALFPTLLSPLLTKRRFCPSCGNTASIVMEMAKKRGDLALDTYKDLDSLLEDRKTWEKVLQNLNAQTMPPENKKQPSPAQRDRLTAWIQTEVFQCDCSKPDPGRVTHPPFESTEYNNTIHDLVGVDFQPAEDFPQDDTGYGFDNIGDVLSLSPVLLENT